MTATPGSVEIDCVLAKVFDRHDFEGAAVGAREADLWGFPGLVGLEPARGAQAPAGAGLEGRKAELGVRRREVVALGARELEELFRGLYADRVRAVVVITRIAAAVAEVAC